MSNSIRNAILRHTGEPRYRAVKPKGIAKKLGFTGEDLPRVKKAIKQLVKEGKLAYGPNHLVCSVTQGPVDSIPDDSLPADGGHETAPAVPNSGIGKPRKDNPTGPRSKHLVGTYRRTAKGFGFVRPEGTLASTGRDSDIYVAAKNSGDAAHGDIVRLRLMSGSNLQGRSERGHSEKDRSEGGRSEGGRSEGRVIDIVERATNRFVGTYFEQTGMGLVQIDGNLFTSPIYVGDPGAKGARDDDKVVLEMVRFPSQVRDGEGVLVQILGQKGQAGIDTLSIIHQFNLPGEFPEDVLENARQQAEAFEVLTRTGSSDLAHGRRDLTGETILTIDPTTARDFDDAISLKRLDHGHWQLGVHIADVSHFVQPKSSLDREAFQRATSVYLPDQVIPMLPEIISNNLASLQPGKVRYAVTALIEFTAEGARVSTDLFKSVITSCRRFTYEEVDHFLADHKLWQDKLEPEVHTLLGRMHTLGMLLRGRRFERGALELSMPELEIDLDAEGRVCGAHLEKNTESHQIIEEFMLAANMAVAETLAEQGLLYLRRVHGNPDPRKLKALTEFVKELGLEVENLESRFELQKLLNDVRSDSREHAVNYAVLRSMQRAVYSPEEEAHYALASDNYCHFTSPIRRYPDLTIHRLIDSLNRGKPPQQSMETLLFLGDHCSDREQRATQAERELNKVKLLHYFQDKIGTEMEGIITGVERFGLFVLGTEIPAEGFVHISSLADDHYRFDRAGHVLQGFRSGNAYRLGDPVRVVVVSVDIDRRELDFRLLGHAGAINRDPRKRKSEKGTTSARQGKKSSPARQPKKPGKKTGRRKRRK
jgi:ribonuclease R